jgi:hypothetical protein
MGKGLNTHLIKGCYYIMRNEAVARFDEFRNFGREEIFTWLQYSPQDKKWIELEDTNYEHRNNLKCTYQPFWLQRGDVFEYESIGGKMGTDEIFNIGGHEVTGELSVQTFANKVYPVSALMNVGLYEKYGGSNINDK